MLENTLSKKGQNITELIKNKVKCVLGTPQKHQMTLK